MTLCTSGSCTTSLLISCQPTLHWVPATTRWWAVVERRAACASQAAEAEWSEPHPRSSALAHHHRSHSGDTCPPSSIISHLQYL